MSTASVPTLPAPPPDAPDPPPASHRVVIEPGRADRQYWRDLFAYRELLLLLAWRNVSVRYKQSVLGVAWAIVRPVLTTLALVLVFGRIAGLKADGGVWYPLFVMTGMIVWLFAAAILSEVSTSLVRNAGLVSKVYFPRLIVPLSGLGTPVVDLLVSLPVLALLMAYAGHLPPWQVVVAPLFLLFAAAATTGFGLLLAALNVTYRDVGHLVPFLVQFGLYVTPVGFATGLVPEAYRLAFHLNPLVFAVDGLRWAVLGVGDPFAGGGWAVSVLVTAALLVAGVRYFRATEKSFVDVI